jgi:hypothetical protein
MNLRLQSGVGQRARETSPEVSHALSVSEFASAVSVVELIDVTVQVNGFNVNVRTLQASLELREVVLALVGAVALFGHVLAYGVVHDMVTSEPPTNVRVGRGRVRVQGGRSHVQVRAQDSSHGSTGDTRNDFGTSLTSLRVNDCDDWRLGASVSGRTLVGVHELGLATNPCFVGNHVTREQREVIVAHGLANTVQHVPRGARAESVLALYLASGNAILRRAHFEDHHDPSTNRSLGGVHDGASQNAELHTAWRATPHTTLRLRTASRGARNPIGRLHVANVSGQALGALGLTMPAHVFEVQVGVGLGNNLSAQAGNRCLHASIIPKGCDTPKSLVEQVFALSEGAFK